MELLLYRKVTLYLTAFFIIIIKFFQTFKLLSKTQTTYTILNNLQSKIEYFFNFNYPNETLLTNNNH